MSKYHKVEETTDRETGEITRIRKTFVVKAKTSEDFFMVFLSGINAIIELSRPSDIKLLAILCSKAVFNTGKISVTPLVRKEIQERLKISTQGFSNAISRLKLQGLVIGEKGDYEINPQFFWKGTSDERSRLLKELSMDVLFKFKKG